MAGEGFEPLTFGFDIIARTRPTFHIFQNIFCLEGVIYKNVGTDCGVVSDCEELVAEDFIFTVCELFALIQYLRIMIFFSSHYLEFINA